MASKTALADTSLENAIDTAAGVRLQVEKCG